MSKSKLWKKRKVNKHAPVEHLGMKYTLAKDNTIHLIQIAIDGSQFDKTLCELPKRKVSVRRFNRNTSVMTPCDGCRVKAEHFAEVARDVTRSMWLNEVRFDPFSPVKVFMPTEPIPTYTQEPLPAEFLPVGSGNLLSVGFATAGVYNWAAESFSS